MLLLVIWVAALQIMLDEGKDKDWFSSMEIRVLAITAVIGFAAFLIWELTELNPIVNLRVFRHRGFSSCMFVLALAFGAFFGLNVLTPQWLQYNMGYTTTWAGMVVAWGGVLSVIFSPIAANLANRIDARILIFIGCLWLGLDTFWRAMGTSDMSYWVICIPLFFMGVGMPMYYVPLTGIGDGIGERRGNGFCGRPHELRAHVIRCLCHLARHDLLAEPQHPSPCRVGERRRQRQRAGGSYLQGSIRKWAARCSITSSDGQSLMLATNGLMMVMAAIFIIAAVSIVLAPKAARAVDAASVGH